MASFASEVSISQGNEFFARFGRFGGDMRLLKKLLTDDEQMRLWVESLLVTAPVEHLAVFVSYQLPSYDELNGTTFDWASDLFKPKFTWQNHESVGTIDRTPGEKSFLVKHFNKKMQSDEVPAWADANGYRAATHEEAVDFAKAHPDLQREFWIVALGSFTLDGGNRVVAVLSRSDAERNLDSDWFGGRWGASRRFLLVCK